MDLYLLSGFGFASLKYILIARGRAARHERAGKKGDDGAKLPAIPPAFQEAVVVPSLWRLLPSVFLLLLLTQILSPPLLPTADKAHHDIAGASQGGGEGLRNRPRHPWHCLSHPAALRVSLLLDHFLETLFLFTVDL